MSRRPHTTTVAETSESAIAAVMPSRGVMTTRVAGACLLFTVALTSTGCKGRSHQAGHAVDAAPASVSSTSEAAPESPRAVRPSLGEPTAEEQKESDSQRRVPLSGQTIAQPEGGFLGFFPLGDDLIVGERNRVLRRAGADGSMKVLLEQPGLAWIDHQGEDLLLFVRDGKRTWIERRPLERPAPCRYIVTSSRGERPAPWRATAGIG
jgi:hypothetical protein